jgi:hypothetical protein
MTIKNKIFYAQQQLRLSKAMHQCREANTICFSKALHVVLLTDIGKTQAVLAI